MPRRPRSRQQFSRRHLPIAFTPFARSMSLLYAAKKIKRDNKNSEMKGNCARSRSGCYCLLWYCVTILFYFIFVCVSNLIVNFR